MKQISEEEFQELFGKFLKAPNITGFYSAWAWHSSSLKKKEKWYRDYLKREQGIEVSK